MKASMRKMKMPECRVGVGYEGSKMKEMAFLMMIAVGLVLPSWAAAPDAKPVSVAELGQFLTTMHGQSDGNIAKGLESMALTERVSEAQLVQWQAALPGRHSREELTILADGSVFLDPPATDVLADAPPDQKAQGAILSSAVGYVAQTLTKLPDFSATRTTVHFEDTPAHTVQVFSPGSMTNWSERDIAYVPLHQSRQSSVQFRYLNGVEMRGSAKMDRAAVSQPESVLATSGEFGPTLSVVLEDAMHGTVDWAYWQQSSIGKLAVFHYSVTEGHSSYAIMLEHGVLREQLFPAYHGEIAIDPATGAILRISVVASFLHSQDIVQSAIAVDYGSVALGGKDRICPLKGIALLRTLVETTSGAAQQAQVNDTTFTGYHALGGDNTGVPAQP